MDLIHPLRLVALAALAVPILLHLWRHRAGPVVKVGSIRHLTATAAARRTSLAVNEKLLLLLRIGCLTLLAFAIAGPHFEAPTRGQQQALVDPDVGSAERAGIVDSLRQAGDRVVEPAEGDLWSLAREADAALPPGSRLTLVAPSAARLIGLRPTVGSFVSLRLVDQAVADPLPKPKTDRHHFDIIAGPNRQSEVWYMQAAIRAVAELRGDSPVVRMTAVSGQVGGIPTRRYLIHLTAIDRDSALVSPAVLAGATLVHFDTPRRGEALVPGAPFRLAVEPAGRGSVATVSLDMPVAELGLTDALPTMVSAIWPTPGAPTPIRQTQQQLLPRAGDIRREGARRPMAFPALLFATLIFVTERLVAHRRRNGA